jgi:hypothetical protein
LFGLLYVRSIVKKSSKIIIITFDSYSGAVTSRSQTEIPDAIGLILVNCVMQVMWLLRASPTHQIQAGRSQAGQAVSKNCFSFQIQDIFLFFHFFKSPTADIFFAVLRIRTSDPGSQTHTIF